MLYETFNIIIKSLSTFVKYGSYRCFVPVAFYVLSHSMQDLLKSPGELLDRTVDYPVLLDRGVR